MRGISVRKVAAALVLAAFVLTACGQGTAATGSVKSIKRPAVESSERQFTAPAEGDAIAIFDTTAGEIRAVLYPDKAPQACANFEGLAQQGFYNGTRFSRVVSGFCAEAGLSADGASSTIWSGSGFAPETTDALHHYSGALCAPVDANGMCSSVFYFMQTLPEAPADDLLSQMTTDGYRQEVIDAYKAAGGAPYLDYTDTVFGQVYSGMDAVDAAAQAEADENGKPVTDITINSVTISTYSAAG